MKRYFLFVSAACRVIAAGAPAADVTDISRYFRDACSLTPTTTGDVHDSTGVGRDITCLVHVGILQRRLAPSNDRKCFGINQDEIFGHYGNSIYEIPADNLSRVF
jgi:hypothetical protein